MTLKGGYRERMEWVFENDMNFTFLGLRVAPGKKRLLCNHCRLLFFFFCAFGPSSLVFLFYFVPFLSARQVGFPWSTDRCHYLIVYTAPSAPNGQNGHVAIIAPLYSAPTFRYNVIAVVTRCCCRFPLAAILFFQRAENGKIE